MSSRELALKGQQKASPSDVESVISIANKGASIAKDWTPGFAKKGLTGVKHFGEWGVGVVTDNRLARFAVGKVEELAGKMRSGKALQFNAKKAVSSLAGIKTVGDLANIDGITQVMIIIIGILFFMIFWWGFNKLNLNQQNCMLMSSTCTLFLIIMIGLSLV
jgi:hypothetical protein